MEKQAFSDFIIIQKRPLYALKLGVYIKIFSSFIFILESKLV